VIDFSFLLDTVTESQPCGPDLDLEGDAEYFNYVIPAEGRLPSTFFDASGKITFDRSSIDLDSEIKEVDALLRKSRDIRLLALMAQFHSATSNIDGFVTCVSSLRELLEARWEDVHPTALDGDFSLRKVSIEALDDRVKVAIPLTFLPLLRDRNAGTITFRGLQLAIKPELKRPSEEPLSRAAVQEAFRSDSGRVALIDTLDRMKTCLASLNAIRNIFLEKSDFDYVPSFSNTAGVLEDILKLVIEEVPDLYGDAGQSPQELGAPAQDQTGSSFSLEDSRTLHSTTLLQELKSHQEAKALLYDIEHYFLSVEPSSPALLLVHQARTLVGRPLVEAIEAFAPARLDSARIIVDPANGFAIGFERMRQLSLAVLSTASGIESESHDPVAVGKAITTRDVAVSAMLSVERFLGAVEPSSPTPLLLAKARALMTKDFAGLLKEILATTTP
jgi:type VI secretion system protein ImpA